MTIMKLAIYRVDDACIIVTSQNHMYKDMCLTHKTRSAIRPEYLLNIINMLHKLITPIIWSWLYNIV